MKKKPKLTQTEVMSNSPPPNNGNDATPRSLGKLFYSLGDLEGNTVEILSLLLKSSYTVTEIASYLKLSDSATSQRLSKLKLHGFVVAHKGENRTRIYSINPETRNRIVTAVNQVFG